MNEMHQRTRRIPTAALTLSLLAATALAELPPNRWQKVGQKEAGCRIGAAVVWLQKEHKFLVLGGLRDDKWTRGEGIGSPYEIMTYDPAGRKWGEVTPTFGVDGFKKVRRRMFLEDGQGRLRLSPSARIANSFAYDGDSGRVFVYGAEPKAFNIVAYDIRGRRWTMISTLRPPAGSDGVWPGEWGPTTVFMEGTSPVFDPVNQDILFIGGRTGNAPTGFVGHWAFSLKDKTWRLLEAPDALLDPLREKVTAAIRPARDAMAAARNVFYAAMGSKEQGEAVKGAPARHLEQAVKNVLAAAEALRGAKADGWRGQALKHATTGTAAALTGLRSAHLELAAGKLNAEIIKTIFTAAWSLDEAADCLRALPGPRSSTAVGYDPVGKHVIVFGGDHGDYLLNDTWLYDCAKRSWRRVFPKVCPSARRGPGRIVWLPGQKRLALVGGSTYLPKFVYFRRTARPLGDIWTFDAAAGRWQLLVPDDKDTPAPTLTCALAAGTGDTLLGLSSKGRWKGVTADYWLMRLVGGKQARKPETTSAAPARTYFTVVEQYDPCWYDAAPRGDRTKVAEWLAGLPANTWTRVPEAPRPAPQRDWGTAIFDPARDQWYHWTGGHMADPADQVSTYHPAVNRWSISYVPSYIGKGIGFAGRPDCMNHTYINYALDPVSKKLVSTSLGGTCVYDPDRREFEPRIAQPFVQHPYYTKTVSTPRGVVCWNRGKYLGLLDVSRRKWNPLPVKGKLPRVVHGDENALCYDPKRNVLWMYAADGYQKPTGKVWRYDMATGTVEEVAAANREAFGRKVRLRETAYVPQLDMVVHNGFVGDRQVAWQPARGRWVLLDTKRDPKHAKDLKQLGGPSIGLMVDPKRKCLWAMGAGRRVFIMKLDVKSLRVIGDSP